MPQEEHKNASFLYLNKPNWNLSMKENGCPFQRITCSANIENNA